MFDKRQLTEELAAECLEDHVGLWSIVWRVRQALNGGNFPIPEVDRTQPGDVRRFTRELIQEMLSLPEMRAGQFVPTDAIVKQFVPWQGSPSEVLERIDTEWDALGREPNIGEIVWFAHRDLLRSDRRNRQPA